MAVLGFCYYIWLSIFESFNRKFLDLVEKYIPTFIISTTSLDTVFKLIELVRAYDAQSLIGNAGGYIEIFLGGNIHTSIFFRHVSKWHIAVAFWKYLWKASG